MNKYTRPLDSVAVFDPSLATRNAGDEIISDAARKQIRRVMPMAFQATIPTHERIGARSYRFSMQAKHSIVAGSNILSGHMMLDRQWRFRPWDALFVKDLILLGVGWRAYGQSRSTPSDMLMRKILSKDGFHSVRDEHTKTEMGKRGIKNVLNTACVTMWDLDLAGLAELPQKKSHRVLTTVNVGQKKAGEIEFLKLLCEEYDEVFVWPQGIDDEFYVKDIIAQLPKVKKIGATLAAYDEMLADPQGIDFVGNRLHGGVRALQHMRRATILAVDNRASEIARDTNLPVISLADGIDAVRDAIRNPKPIEVTLPTEQIAQWRGQFADDVAR